jgi:phage repressor protein C with HTH and peptisase S24 domain
MTPTLAPGDRVLVRYGVSARLRDVVVARFPDGTLAVKRIGAAASTRTGADGWWLVSDNPDEGVDSRHRGAFADDAVLGVVRLRVWPRPGRVARR